MNRLGTERYARWCGRGTNYPPIRFTSGSVEISKTDTEENAIVFSDDTSVSYKVYDADKNPVYFTQDSDDSDSFYYSESADDLCELTVSTSDIYLYNLPVGTYYLEETAAPANYQKTDQLIEFEVTEGQWTSETTTVTVENEYIGDDTVLQVNKLDENGDCITSDETRFTVTDSTSLESNLSEAYCFVDEGTDETLGHKYRLARSDDTDTVKELETYQGKLYITGLSCGTDYYLYEIAAPDGYYYSSQAYTGFCLTTASSVLNITNKKYVGKVEITKTDENGDLMTDIVRFKIYKDSECSDDPVYFRRLDDLEDDDENVISSCYEYVTASEADSDCVTEIETAAGKATLIGLPYYYYYYTGSYWDCGTQTYYLQETYAPLGYGLGTTSFSSTASSLTQEVIFQNTVNAGHVNVTKQDNAGNDLTKDIVKFQIYDSNGDLVYVAKDTDGYYVSNIAADNTIDTIETTDGKVSVRYLPLGKYTLVETQTPAGYAVISDTTFTVEASNYTTPLEVTVKNQHNTGNFTLSKVDSEGTVITSDTASFEIKDKDGNLMTFTLNAGEYDYDADGTVTVLTTTDGALSVNALPIGTYTIAETDTPEGYELAASMEITITGDNYDTDLEVSFTDYHDSGDVMVVKLDTDGELIDSNAIVFKLYDSDGNLVRLYNTGEKTENGRVYSASGTGYAYSRLTSYGGKIYIKGLPVGSYYLKEVVAPSGYSLYLDEIPFTVTDENYFEPLKVEVKDPEYSFGSEKYASSSYQKIEEKDETDNCGYGYNGTAEDYANGNKNYIVVDSAEDIVTFTLRVMNRSAKNFENVVIIDSLADIGDTGAVNLNQERGSEFTLVLADKANITVTMFDENGSEIALDDSDYTISYSGKTAYTDRDWNGTSAWLSAPDDTTRSFRVVMDSDFVLPSGYTLQVTFDSKIQNAEPLEIAWNAFGYRYYVGSIELTPEPPKVGVKIPDAPSITKNVEDVSDAMDNETDTYTFYVYEVTTDPSSGEETETLVKTLEVSPNVKTELTPHRIVNGEDNNGYIESGHTYKIVEAASKKTTLLKVTGSEDSGKEMAFSFTYDPEEKGAEATFTNGQSYNGEVILTKTNRSGDTLSGVEYELQDTSGNVYNISLSDAKNAYVIDSTSSSTAMTTNSDWQIRIVNLPYGDYVLVETKTLDGYVLSATGLTFTIDDDDFILEDTDQDGTLEEEELEILPEKISAVNEVNSLTIRKVSGKDGTTLVAGAELTITNVADPGDVTIVTTKADEAIEITGLKAGTYTIRETTTPDGFLTAADVTFTIDEYGKVTVDGKEADSNTILIVDEVDYGSITVTKTGLMPDTADIENSTVTYKDGVLSGATFALYAAEEIKVQGTVFYEAEDFIAEATTGTDGTATFEDLPRGKYYLVETAGASGYLLDSSKISVSVGYSEQGTVCEIEPVSVTVNNKRIKLEVSVEKTEKDGRTAVAGAVFGLYAAENMTIGTTSVWAATLLESVTTDADGKATFTIDLPYGKYYVKEISAADGYVLSNEVYDIVFDDTLAKEADTSTATVSVTGEFTNDYTKVLISKKDAETDDFLAGAKLKLLNESGNTVAEWTSGDEAKEITHLPYGKYTLVEIEAPEGYALADSETFTVDENSKSLEIVMYDSEVESVSYTFGGVKPYLYDDADKSKAGLDASQFTFVSENISWPGSEENDDTYKFDTKEDAGTNADGSGKRTATNGKDGSFTFAAYEFPTAGTWVFEVTEQVDSASSSYIEYDKVSYTVTVVVGQVNSTDDIYTITSITVNNGTVDIYTYSYTDAEDKVTTKTEENSLVTGLTMLPGNSVIGFTNVYTAEGELELAGTKSYGLDMTDGQFTFQAVEAKKDDTSGNYYATDKTYTGSSDKDGNITFDKISYEYADIGEYKYTITEVLPTGATQANGYSDAGILYDTSSKVVYVSVSDAEAGKLTVTVKDEQGNELDETALKEAISFTNNYTKVEILKRDGEGNALSGAELQVLNASGEVIETWTSGESAHTINALPVGAYTLHEVSAPSGYALAADVAFTVTGTETGTISVTMDNSLTSLKISKVSGYDETPVVGADLTITDASDNSVIRTVTTTDEGVIELTGILAGTYVISETKTPEGFVTASDVEFTIKADGTVTVDEKTVDCITIKDELVYGSIVVKKPVKFRKQWIIVVKIISFPMKMVRLKV